MSKIMFVMITCLLVFVGLFAYLNNETTSFSDQQKSILVKNGAGPGKDLNVPARPKRVVFLNSSSLDLWLGAGGKDTVIAYVEHKTAPEGLYEQVAGAKIIGVNNNISPEIVLEQKPDLVVGSGIGNAQATLGTILQQANIPVLTIANNSLADTFYELQLYGQMTGHPELAEKEIARINARIKEIGQTFAGKRKPKVALIWGTPASFSLLVPNSRQGEFLSLAGGENIVKELGTSSRYVPISLEFIAKENPDYLFFINMGNRQKINDALQSLLASNSSWQLLRAVRENKVYVLPPELFTAHYGLSVDKSIEYMNKLLYSQ